MFNQIKGVEDLKKLKQDKKLSTPKRDEYTNMLSSLWVLAGALVGYWAMRKKKQGK